MKKSYPGFPVVKSIKEKVPKKTLPVFQEGSSFALDHGEKMMFRLNRKLN